MTRSSAPGLSWALREATRVATDVDRMLAERLGLRPLDYAAMGHVMGAGEPLGPVELAHRLGISTGSGTELVDRLERAGQVERVRHLGDRRRVVVQARPAAAQRILAELGSLSTAIDDLADDLTDEEQAVVERYLRGAADRMRHFTATHRA